MRYCTFFFLQGLFFLLCTFSSPAQDSPISYLALGDSYTVGENVAQNERWPVQLVHTLRERGYEIDDPEIIAVTGWTTLDLKKAIARASLKTEYDLVTLLIGVNDQYQRFDINNYSENFSDLLSKAVELSGNRSSHVIVLSIPDYGVTPFGKKKNAQKIAREIARYNTINKKISDSLGVHYADITGLSKKAATKPDLVAGDGLHPSGKLYRQWVGKILPLLLPELKKWGE